jgi:tetratricopeptide (TPR) repeat protein
LLSIISIFALYKKISLDHYYRIALKSFVQKQHKIGGDRYFCSYAILETIKILRKKREKDALINLAFARVDKAMKILKNLNRNDLRISVAAHFDFEEALIEFEMLIKKQPQNMFILGEMAELYYMTSQYSLLNMVLSKIDEKKSLSYTNAKKAYFTIFLNMRDGDFLPASMDGNNVIKVFNKNKAYVEEAKTYLLMGIIYKASTIFDTAQFMFTTALEAFKRLNDKIGMIETYGNLAMLMSVQERYEETEAYLNKAEELSDNNKAKAYILNQKGLTNFLQNKNEEALNLLKEAAKVNSENNNMGGLAFSNEIIAYILYEQNDFIGAIDHSAGAEKIYKELSNFSAMLETKYIQALSLYELDKLDASEKIAREIIDTAKKETTSFHLANTYNLLGVIYIAKKDLPRARTLIKESLRLEQKNERIEGIATDYFNLGLIESKIGERKDALLSMENALEFASKFGETKLSKIIKDKIKTLT